MTDLLPPTPKFSISRWLLSMIISVSVIGGAITATGVLFLAQGFFDTGRDPVIHEEKSTVPDAEFDRRLRLLEQRAQQTQSPAAPQNAQAITDLQNKVEKLQNTPSQDTRMAQIVVGLTELKNEASLQQGISTLKQAVKDTLVQQDLNDLSALLQDTPSKDALLNQIQDVQKSFNQPAAAPVQTDMNWKSRAQQAMTHFVKIEKTDTLNQKKTNNDTLDRMQQAVSYENYPLAAQLADRLPKDPATQALALKLQAKMKVQQLVQKTISAVGTTLGQKEGSLY